jgi:hypothetical protein
MIPETARIRMVTGSNARTFTRLFIPDSIVSQWYPVQKKISDPSRFAAVQQQVSIIADTVLR